MKSLLRKLSRVDRPDRREELEHDAAEQIKMAGSQPPPEAQASSWASSAPPAPEPATPAGPTASAAPAAAGQGGSGGRRLTVQERMAARELQSH